MTLCDKKLKVKCCWQSNISAAYSELIVKDLKGLQEIQQRKKSKKIKHHYHQRYQCVTTSRTKVSLTQRSKILRSQPNQQIKPISAKKLKARSLKRTPKGYHNQQKIRFQRELQFGQSSQIDNYHSIRFRSNSQNNQYDIIKNFPNMPENKYSNIEHQQMQYRDSKSTVKKSYLLQYQAPKYNQTVPYPTKFNAENQHRNQLMPIQHQQQLFPINNYQWPSLQQQYKSRLSKFSKYSNEFNQVQQRFPEAKQTLSEIYREKTLQSMIDEQKSVKQKIEQSQIMINFFNPSPSRLLEIPNHELNGFAKH